MSNTDKALTDACARLAERIESINYAEQHKAERIERKGTTLYIHVYGATEADTMRRLDNARY